MAEIACTKIGRNTLFTGLIGHMAALLAAMLSSSGTEHFFGMVYPLSCLLLAVGSFAELKTRGRAPLTDWRFYLTAAATVIPFVGPLIVLGLLYFFQAGGPERQTSLTGLVPAFFRMKANLLIVFVWMVLLLILFVLTNSQDDPYYKKRYRNHQNRNVPQSVLTEDFRGHEMRK